METDCNVPEAQKKRHQNTTQVTSQQNEQPSTSDNYAHHVGKG